MKKILITIMLGIFLLSIVSVSATEYIGKQYAQVYISDGCEVGGFNCPASYLCNISISDPDLNQIVLNAPMTRNETLYNYTLVETGMLGNYLVNINCDNSTFAGASEHILKITTTGREPKLAVTLILLLSSFVLFITALRIKNQAVGFMSGLLFLITGTYIMIFGLGDAADMYTQAVAYVTIAFGAFISLVSGVEWLKEVE